MVVVINSFYLNLILLSMILSPPIIALSRLFFPLFSLFILLVHSNEDFSLQLFCLFDIFLKIILFDLEDLPEVVDIITNLQMFLILVISFALS